jgi:hypothetical protein
VPSNRRGIRASATEVSLCVERLNNVCGSDRFERRL